MERQEEEGQMVPVYVGLLTYNPGIKIVNLDVDYIIDNQTLTHTEIGIVKVLEMVESNGQGRYFVAEGGNFGKALIKYLGNDSEVVGQARNFEEFGFHREVLNIIRDQESDRNRGREIRFVNELNHPNITKILAFLSPNGTAERINALVIEDAAQGTLQSYVKQIGTQFTDERIKQFALQLASALRYCHKYNIMHRDVRPANIYVHWDGNQIKLGNFGYARLDDESSLLKTANKGDDVVYKAPEIIKNTELTTYGKSVDVYSFGMVVWEPFQNEFRRPIKSHTKVKNHLEAGHRPEIRGDLGDLIAQLIVRCWINETKVEARPTMTDVVLTLDPANLP